jgi:hypothetical protein
MEAKKGVWNRVFNPVVEPARRLAFHPDEAKTGILKTLASGSHQRRQNHPLGTA